MINELRTKVGLLDAKVITTYHVDWLTYAHVRQAGKLGLEDIVELAYGKPIEMLGCGNDTDMACSVKKEELADYDLETISEIIENGSFEDYQLNLVLTDLANKDIIPQGSYVVTMSW